MPNQNSKETYSSPMKFGAEPARQTMYRPNVSTDIQYKTHEEAIPKAVFSNSTLIPAEQDVNFLTQYAAIEKYANADLAKGAHSLMLKASVALTKLREDAKMMQLSEAYTEIGKWAELKKYYAVFFDKIEPLQTEAAGYENNANQIIRKMQPKQGNASLEDRIVTEMRRREIRDAVRTKSGNDRISVELEYRSALESGDDEFTIAIEEAPRYFALISESVKTEGFQARLERQNPELAAQVRELLFVHKAVKYALDEMTKDAQHIAGIVTVKFDHHRRDKYSEVESDESLTMRKGHVRDPLPEPQKNDY
ncbi:MAG: hypothetical protein FD131_3963 [Rhodocyclaceae bacterium]|nr:MAG: hypothetical protein FD131_3963 [Rhodocyclaceae bacterium]